MASAPDPVMTEPTVAAPAKPRVMTPLEEAALTCVAVTWEPKLTGPVPEMYKVPVPSEMVEDSIKPCVPEAMVNSVPDAEIAPT